MNTSIQYATKKIQPVKVSGYKIMRTPLFLHLFRSQEPDQILAFNLEMIEKNMKSLLLSTILPLAFVSFYGTSRENFTSTVEKLDGELGKGGRLEPKVKPDLC